MEHLNPRGVLFPARLPTFQRLPASGAVEAFVRWFWIAEWDVVPGRISRQHLIAFPACNLVVENDVVGIAGPTTKASFRDLVGRGWVVGALLRPAAVPHLCPHPASLRDSYHDVALPDLHAAVSHARSHPEHPEQTVAAYTEWLLRRLPEPSDEALLANQIVDAVDTESTLLTVADLAARFQVPERTLQRLTTKYVGLSPLALIRRRRLQEAVDRVRTEPEVSLARIAHELGYADHAHLTADFRTVLGWTPSAYRREHADGAEG